MNVRWNKGLWEKRRGKKSERTSRLVLRRVGEIQRSSEVSGGFECHNAHKPSSIASHRGG